MHTHMAIVELMDRSTGEPLAVMDGRLITEMRTAAVSAAAFAALAPLHFETPPKSFGILGSGVQARAHVHALRHVWPEMHDIRIWSPNRGTCGAMRRRHRADKPCRSKRRPQPTLCSPPRCRRTRF